MLTVLLIFFAGFIFVIIGIMVITVPYIIRRNRRIFSSALFEVMREGLPLEEGLKAYYLDASFTIKHVFRNVLKGLYRGQSLSQSMMKNRIFLGKRAIKLMQAGEKSGQLLNMAKVLDDICAEDERRYFDYKSIPARFYPFYLVLLILAIFPIAETFTKALLQFEEMFAEFELNAEAVFTTRRFFFHMTRIGFVALLIYLIYILLRYAGVRLGKAGYYVPFIGLCARDHNLSYFCRTLAISLKRLKTLPEALKLTGEAMPFYEYFSSAEAALRDIEKGKSLSESIPEGILFPPTAKLLIRSGELSGNLDGNLERAAHYYHTSYVKRSQLIWRITLPVVVIWAGIIVGAYGLVIFSLLRRLTDASMAG